MVNNAPPGSWVLVSLSELVSDIQAGFACGEKNVPNGIAHLRMNNISVDGKLDLHLVRQVPKSTPQKQHYLENGDILFCSTNSSKLVGKSALFELEGDFVFSNHLTRLRTFSGLVINKFLQEYLWSLWQKGDFEAKCKHWVNQSSLPKVKLLETTIPLPPFDEQRRIVVKLEKLLAKIDACKERLDKIPGILTRFRQAVLASACGGSLTADWRKARKCSSNTKSAQSGIPGNWNETKLAEIASVIDPNPSHRYPPYADDGVPLLATEQCDGINEWNLSTAKLAARSFYEQRCDAHGFFEDDIIFARKGRLGLARRPPIGTPYAFSHTIFIIRVTDKKVLNSDYLLWFLRQDSCVSWLVKEMNSNTGVPTLGKGFMLQLPVKWPQLAEQQEIVRRVEALFEFVDRIEERYNKAKKHVDRLTQSILAKAFRGELVPQDPNDEPASVLLERIRQERTEREAGRKSQNKAFGGKLTRKPGKTRKAEKTTAKGAS